MKKNKTFLIISLILSVWIVPMEMKAKIETPDSLTPIVARFEHVAFNVEDPRAVAQWYIKHFGMKIIRQSGEPTFTTFIADSGEHMMIEFFCNTNYPFFLANNIHVMSLHLAFATPDIEATIQNLLTDGATWADTLTTTPSGDKVCILRDPWGIAIQLVQRATSMLHHDRIYIEHVAFNVKDSKALAGWYMQWLSMKVQREGSAPVFGMFISDTKRKMMFEFYQNSNYPIFDTNVIHPMSFHVAFHVEDVAKTRLLLLSNNATVEDDIVTTSAGDTILMMRDPFGIPIQFVCRTQPMLK